MTDSILDLIVNTEETQNNIVDFYGKPEVIYLGPDEQVCQLYNYMHKVINNLFRCLYF